MNNARPYKSERSENLHGTFAVPGDKSISHRTVMFGLLAEGTTTATGLLEGEDVMATAAAATAMGASVRKDDQGTWHIQGTGGKLGQPQDIMDMGNSGTSARLLMGLVSGHAIEARFTGDASLCKRPMKRVMNPLTEMGAGFTDHQDGKLPLTLKGSATLNAITYELPVASAQVKSAVLLAGLNAQGTTTVIESVPTRDHTENMLKGFGVNITTVQNDNGAYEISIQGGQTLKACHVDVPSDPSSAAFPTVAALLCKGSDIILKSIGMNDRRNGIYKVLQNMGADLTLENERIEAGEPVADIHVKGTKTLQGVTVDPEIVPSMIDEFPVLAMAAACADGVTTMTNLAELRVKESDRLAMVANGLRACGVELEEGPDSLTIFGNGTPPTGGALIETALDHRIAMSFLVLGLATEKPVTIDDISPVNTSFPGFVDKMTALGAHISPAD